MLKTLGVHATIKPLSLAIICATLLFTSGATAADSVETEEVLVTATRLSRTLEDIAGTVSVISSKNIEESLMQDMDDLIRYQPGISMSTASRGGNEGFIIRGIGGNRILMIVDGIRSSDMYAAGPSSYGKDAFEVDDLRSVEIIRGPASVLYGADAMGGAVILHSKSARDYLTDDSNTSLGMRMAYNSANELGKLGLTMATQQRSFDILVQYTHRSFDESEVNGSAELNPQNGENNALLLKAGWAPKEGLRYTATLDFLEEEVETSLLSALSTSVFQADGVDTTDRYRFSLAQDWELDAGFADNVNTQLYWQETDAVQFTTEEKTSYSFLDPADPTTYGGSLANRFSDFGFKQTTLGIESSFQKQITAKSIQNTLVYGFNYEITDTERPRNRCDTEVSTGSVTCGISAYPFAPAEVFPNKTFPDTETRRSGIYLQDEISLAGGGLSIIPGLRYDNYEMKADVSGVLDTQSLGYGITDFESSEVSLSLGLIYEFSVSTSFFVQYAEGFRPPNFNEANQSFVNLGFGYALVPNPDLKEETSRNLEAGIRSSFGDTSLSFVVYQNDYKDFIETQFVETVDDLSIFQEQNTGSVEIYGAEIEGAQILSAQWSLRASIAYSRGNNKVTDQALNSVEPLTGVFGLRFDSANQLWGFEAMLRLVGEKDRVADIDDVIADSYEVVDLIAHYNLGDKTKVRLGVFNVLDTEYARWSNIQSLSASDTDLIARSQAPGTTLRLSLNHRF